MKKVILNIPDNKYQFFMELVHNLGFDLEPDAEMDIPEEHKAIVRERIELSKSNPDRLLDWEEVEDKFKLD
ncbi:addiction module protein [Reichenbachiella ulvae]|uniref:Addiction module protein n=1 Tax=Reichenbachiella ulvae TaxID=2980104 RepID=A0ABT3CVU5_9BACT|nr:addiction module protein [Reichenbachiella ulvae]MCV9387752.1 addiction module protein [Reichenbachiella ulvae]